MKNLSIEQINILKKYEKQFQQAVYGKYLRAQPTSFYSDLVQICNEQGIHIKLSCPSCLFNAVSRLGNMYYQALEAQKSEHPATADLSDSSDSLKQSEESNLSNDSNNSDSLPVADSVNDTKKSDDEINLKTPSKASKKLSDSAKSKNNKTNKRK